MNPRSGQDVGANPVPELDGLSEQPRLPLSYGQAQLWFLDQLSPGETTYNIQLAYRLRGPLDVDALRRSLRLVVARHDSLRATFGVADGEPFQVIAPASTVELPVTDLSALPVNERSAAASREIQAEVDTAFDLATGPLYRFRLIQVAEAEHILCIAFHHIVTDGWSSGIINNELAAAYTAYVGGTEPVLPEIEMRYADVIEDERQHLQGDEFEEDLEFWAKYLEKLPVLELPTDRRRPATASQGGDWIATPLPAELVEGVRALSQERGASLFMVLATALNVVLARYTGAEDVPIGIPMLGRIDPELENVVGLFINMVVLRTDLSGDPTFAELLDRVVDANFDIYDHQNVPFDKIVDRVQPSRDPSRNPLFQVGTQLLTDSNSGNSLAFPGVTVEPVMLGSGRARYDLSINFIESGDGLTIGIEYATDLFDRWRIEALVGHIGQVLAGAVADPNLKVSQLPLLTPAERTEILAGGRGEQVTYSDAPIHATVSEIAKANPDAVAAVCRGVELTYGDLDRRSDQLARVLRARGLRHEQIVAIAMDRDTDALIAMLGVLKAGGAFAVMDPTHPASRLDYMLRDTAAPLVITRSTLADKLPEPAGWAVIALDTAQAELDASDPDAPLEEWATQDSLAYVLYTSGSTGKPKGVLIEHRALRCFVEAYIRTFDFTAEDRLLQLPALTFDMSQGEIFTALTIGATLVQVSPEEGLSPDALAALMRNQRVTYAGLSPAMLSVVEAEPYPALRYVMGGADALPAELVNKWNLPGRRFVNLYGPTEAAIACTEYECEHVEWQSSPPIGYPELNRQVYIVDKANNLVPKGVPGELLIGGGEGLARGYLNQPELTAEKFVADPIRGEGKVYRSGDLVRWTPGLAIDFLGRIDSQVKLRGLRIELGEIESAMLTHPQVQMATVLLHTDARGEKQLVGYFTAVNGEAPEVADLRRHLGETLPEYMVPTAWVALEEFPLTAARKIDRKALPEPAAASAALERQFVAPASQTEQEVAKIFAEVLSVPEVGADQNFFERGGNSLQAMRAVSRINKAFRVKVNIRLLYGSSTVSAIAAKIDELAAAKAGGR